MKPLVFSLVPRCQGVRIGEVDHQSSRFFDVLKAGKLLAVIQRQCHAQSALKYDDKRQSPLVLSASVVPA